MMRKFKINLKVKGTKQRWKRKKNTPCQMQDTQAINLRRASNDRCRMEEGEEVGMESFRLNRQVRLEVRWED